MTTSLLAPISPKFSNIQKAVNNIRTNGVQPLYFLIAFLHQLHKIAFNIDKCFKKILKGSIYIKVYFLFTIYLWAKSGSKIGNIHPIFFEIHNEVYTREINKKYL